MPSAALAWLARAFGFRARMRLPGPGGTIRHAEMELADGVIMLGCPGPDYRNPRQLGRLSQSLYVNVDDVDEPFEHAKRAGARIHEEPADRFYGDRRYAAEDPEGHRWYFARHVRDVAPADLKPPAS
jgi:PhnB protein